MLYGYPGLLSAKSLALTGFPATARPISALKHTIRKMASNTPSSAEQMGEAQKEISVSEFFAKNRHLLGFDNPRKALLTTIKEGVDNSLDACEEAGILPDIDIEIHQLEEDRFRVVIADNGPGIVKEQMSKIFGKLLYGSKFHSRRQSRGQQGIGISAAGLYGQMTTGKGVIITSKIARKKEPVTMSIQMDLTNNKEDARPEELPKDWDHRKQGTRFEVVLEASYQRGIRSVDDYVKQTAVSNPHATIRYQPPNVEEARVYERSTKQVPVQTEEIKPHPYGVELGELMTMMRDTSARYLPSFLQEDFCRVGRKKALEIVDLADELAGSELNLNHKSYPKNMSRRGSDFLYRAIQKTKITAPPTSCLSPIGEERIREGLQKECDADFYAVATRPPAVYRGNPFQIEVGIAWGRPGGDELAVDTKGRITKTKKKKAKIDTEDLLGNADDAVRVLRFANRVPLLFQQSGCCFTKAVSSTTWRNYGLSQAKGSVPTGSAVILIHMASVWVPFTSEAKEAVASYPEIQKEVKRALQEAGRKLGAHIRREKKVANEFEKRSYIDQYLPHVGIGLQEILGLTAEEREDTVDNLKETLETNRKIG